MPLIINKWQPASSFSQQYIQFINYICSTIQAVAAILKKTFCDIEVCMARSRLSGYLESLLAWPSEGSLTKECWCWTTCKTVWKVPLQQVLNFLKNPFLLWDFLKHGSIAPSGECALCFCVLSELVLKTLVLPSFSVPKIL